MAITTRGLASNNYYINNDILVELTSTYSDGYFIIFLTNETTNITTRNLISHQDSQKKATINLSPIIKSIFSLPKFVSQSSIVGQPPTHDGRDLITININHSRHETAPIVFQKYFIRGGQRTQKTNVVSPVGWLQPNGIYPVWTGLPYTASFMPNTGSIQALNPPSDIIDYRRESGCGSSYIRFLNQMGGYSYWLFSSGKEIDSNKPLGSFTKYGYYGKGTVVDFFSVPPSNVIDLGHESDTKLSVSGKVPLKYIDLIKDLIISPEVHVYSNAAFRRVYVQSGSVDKDLNKRAYQVKLSFDMNNKFNPSILWSN